MDAQRNMKIVCGGIAQCPDGTYAHGTGILFAPQFIADERDWISKMRAARRDRAGVLLPRAVLHRARWRGTYADSRLIDARGQHLATLTATSCRCICHARTSYGRALWGFVDAILEDIGAAGIYWDEMSHSVLWYAEQAPWDGVSVAIDPASHRVIRKTTSVPLIMQPLQLAIVDYVRERGAFLMANTQAPTRTMTREQIVRFVETGSFSAMADTHLGCPLGLGNHHDDSTAATAASNARGILRESGLYYGHHYVRAPEEWNFFAPMFPFTPVELREGMVIGEDRIATAVSGRFGFPDGAAAEVYVVGGDGRRVADPDVKEVTEGGRRRYEIRMPGDQFAIIVRK